MIFTFKLARRLAQAYAVVSSAIISVACSGDRLFEALIPSRPTVISIVISPDSVSITPGATIALAAEPRDSTGEPLVDRLISWSSDAPLVATVSERGDVLGVAVGVATISATSEGRVARANVAVVAAGGGEGNGEGGGGGSGGGGGGSGSEAPVTGYHVSPSGSSTGDGSAAKPWSLSAALSGAGGRIQPGDTVWLRAGTYRGDFRSSVAGASGRPVVFRQHPNERATINGRLRVDGPDVVFWGFEVMNSNPLSNGKLPGVETHAARSKFINLIIHDVAQQGITFWDGAVDAEVYGCIVYNNGVHENLDHGIYVHNGRGGTKLIRDNVFFNNLAYGIHVYAGPDDVIQRNVHLVGNVSFNNGTISNNYTAKGNIIVGAEVAGEGMRVVDNLLWLSGTVGENLRAGYTAASRDIVVQGNYVWGGSAALVVMDWSSATVRGNVIGGVADVVDLRDPSTSGHQWAGNRYYRSPSASAWRFGSSVYSLSGWQSATRLGSTDAAQSSVPAIPTIVVRPNAYERGRAHVVVYNWPEQASVAVDLSALLTPGQEYEIRNVQNVFGAPVVSGRYGGGTVLVPMTGVAPPSRIGRSTRTPPRTGPEFDAFLVTTKP